MSDPVALLEKIRELEQVISNQRHELANNARVIEQRNRQLDALGVVWCDGGCTGGMHRYQPSRPVSAGAVALLVTNAGRAVRWFVSHAGKRAADRQAAWAAARDTLLAEVPGPFRSMVRHASGPTPDEACGGELPLEEMTTDDLQRVHGRLAQVLLERLDAETPRERLKRTLTDNAASWAALPAEIRNAVSTRGVFDPSPYVPTRELEQCVACKGAGGDDGTCTECGGTGFVDVGVQRGS